MPTYTFKSNKTGKEWDDTMSYTKLDDYYKEHDCQQVIGIPQQIISHGEIKLKTDDGFNDRLKEIKKTAGRNSTISDSIR